MRRTRSLKFGPVLPVILMNKIRALFSVLVLAFASIPLSGWAQGYQQEFSGGSLPAGWTAWDGYALAYPSDTANHASFQMTGSQLSISMPAGHEHNMWWMQHAAALRQFSGTGIYEIKVDSQLVGDQQFGLVFQKDPANFLIFMLYSYTGDTVKGYVERFSNVGGQQYKHTYGGGSIATPMPAPGPFYLRVAVTDNANPANREWTFSWSPNGATWTPLVSGNLEGSAASENAGTLQSVGVFAGNQPYNFSSHTALFDYFRYYPDANSLPLAAPANIVVRSANNSVDLWWDSLPGATSYGIYAATSAGGPFTLVATTAQTHYTQTGLTNNVARYYAVSAFKSAVEGPQSAAQKAMPHEPGAMAALPTSGLEFALSASELAYVLPNGAPVTYWPSALGPRVAATAQADRRPSFVSSGVNGQPAVRFDGHDDYLSLPAGFTDFTAGTSVYVVMRASVPQTGFKLLLLGNGADQQNIGLGRAWESSGFEYFTDSSNDVSWFNTTSGLVAGEPMLLSVLQDAGTANSQSFAELSKNGVPQFGQNLYVPPVASRNTNYIGKSYWAEGIFQGDIAELLLYNRKLSSQEHAAVLDYISQRYGLGSGANPQPEPLQAPAQITATPGDGSISLQWNAVTDATGYRVYRAIGSSQTFTQIASPTATTFLDMGLVNGTTYKYKVSAYNSNEESAQSTVVSTQPVASPPPGTTLPTNGLVLLLKADRAAEQFTNGQAVTLWDDSSSNNYDAEAGSNAPTLVTNALNGKPVVRFDGSNDYMTLPAGFANFTAGVSLYIVARPTVLQSGFKFLVLGNGAAQQNIGLGRAGSTNGLQYWTDSSGGSTEWFDTSYGLQANQASLISLLQAPGTANSLSFAEVAQNGVPIYGENVFVPPVTNRGLNYIGKSYWNEGLFQGDIAEIILYNRQLTSTEQSTVRTYISEKYGLSLP